MEVRTVAIDRDAPAPSLMLLFAAPGIILALGFGILSGYEGWMVGIVADPETIAWYHFGSETMRAHGGWMYESAFRYAVVAALESLGGVLFSTAFVWGAIRRQGPWLGWCYLAVLIVIAIRTTELWWR